MTNKALPGCPLNAASLEALRQAADAACQTAPLDGIRVAGVVVDDTDVRCVTSTRMQPMVDAITKHWNAEQTLALRAFIDAGHLVADEADGDERWQLRLDGAEELSASQMLTLNEQAKEITTEVRSALRAAEDRMRDEQVPALLAAQRRAEASDNREQLRRKLAHTAPGTAQLFG